jgi:hypothetical protein
MPARKTSPTHLPHGMGRLKVEWPPVPDVPAYRVAAVEAWLGAHRNVRRPLTVASPLLAVICALFEKQHPLPTRRALSEALECNIFSIDGAISTALGEGEITEEYRYEPGNVAAHASIRRRRYILPSQELYDVYSAVDRSRDPNRAASQKLVG